MDTTTTQPAPPPAPQPASQRPRRRRSSGVGIVIGVVVVVVALLGLAVAAVASVTISVEGTTDSGTEAFTDVDAIVLDLGSADVELVAGRGDVVVDHEVHTGWLDGEAEARLRDGELELTFDCPGWADLPFTDGCDGDYVISVPTGVVVTGGTDNGSLRIDGLADAVDVSTDNGDIHLVATSDDVRVDTSNGRITGTDLASARIEATTSNGPVVLDFAAAPEDVQVDTSNGLVHVQVPDDGLAYDVDASTSNGSLSTSVTVDDGAPRRLELTTSNGDVLVETR
jgi:hypothetical protein